MNAYNPFRDQFEEAPDYTESLRHWMDQANAQHRVNVAEIRAREIAEGHRAGAVCQCCDGPAIAGWCPSCEPTPDVGAIPTLAPITTAARQIDPQTWERRS